VGTRSPSTPFGSVDRPVSPCAFALGSGGRFVARGIDVNKYLPDVLKAAHNHKGASFVEIFQNCIVYNDDVFAPFTAKEYATDMQLWLKPGEPMLYAGGTKGLTLDCESLSVKVVDVVEGNWEAAEVIVHDPRNKMVAHMLVDMPFGPFPMALGVIYEDPAPTFESALLDQNKQAAAGKVANLQALVGKGQSWMVEKEPHAI
jgi:2-oxoglutarate ferredoxin oxidoreductase subunit beta